MRGLHAAPSARSPRLRTLASALTTVACLLAATFGISTVGAQSIDGARAEAEALAGELADARSRLGELAEEYNKAGADLADTQARAAAARAQLDTYQGTLELTRAQLRDYALAAYMSGGSERELDGFFGADANTIDQRLNYLSSAAGNRRQLLDDVAEASRRVDRQLAVLREAEAAATAEQQRLDTARTEAEALEARAADLLEQAEGRLADLVAEAEARRAEEEAAAALAAARATATVPRSTANSGGTIRTPIAYTPPPGIRPEAAIALQAAMSQIGVPYVWGGSSPSVGFDCSGLIYWAYRQAGVVLSRPADYQRDDAIRITYEQLLPGDLVFYGEPVSHAGIYVGNDQVLNAPQTGDVVNVKNMFYSSKPMTYGRVV